MTRSLTVVASLVGALTLLIAIAAVSGVAQWNRSSARSMKRLASAGAVAGSARPSIYTREQLAGLPAPVVRFFDYVLTPGQRLVALARVRHTGDFAQTPGQWKSFTSEQLFSVQPVGFIWDASIQMMPLFQVRVRDSYINGAGSMLGTISGVIRIVNAHDTPAMASASLLRYLAEAAWFPTAFLPGQGVQWSAIDDHAARATLTDGATTVSMDVHFAADGGIASTSALREREVNGRSVAMQWEGTYSSEFLLVDGMKIPKSAEVSWILPEGRAPYYRGDIVQIAYDYAR